MQHKRVLARLCFLNVKEKKVKTMKFTGILFVIITCGYAQVFSMAAGESKTGTIRRLIEDDRPGDLERLLVGWHIDEAKSAINHIFRPPLNCAVTVGRVACVRVLLAHNADPNSSDEHSRSALFRAAQVNGELVLLLLDAGAAHVEHRERGEWPVHIAAYDGLRFVSTEKVMPAAAEPTPEELRRSYRPDALMVLLGHDDVNVNLRSRAGLTSLHLVMDKLARLRQHALSIGCSLGLPDYVSLQEKYLIHISWLVFAGANCEACDRDGKVPIMHADRSQHAMIREEITRALAARRTRLEPTAETINHFIICLPRELARLIADFIIQL